MMGILQTCCLFKELGESIMHSMQELNIWQAQNVYYFNLSTSTFSCIILQLKM